MEEIGQEEVERAKHNMTKGNEGRLEMMEMAGEVGAKWTEGY